MNETTRRSIVKGAAWSAPAIAASVSVAGASASGEEPCAFTGARLIMMDSKGDVLYDRTTKNYNDPVPTTIPDLVEGGIYYIHAAAGTMDASGKFICTQQNALTIVPDGLSKGLYPTSIPVNASSEGMFTRVIFTVPIGYVPPQYDTAYDAYFPGYSIVPLHAAEPFTQRIPGALARVVRYANVRDTEATVTVDGVTQ